MTDANAKRVSVTTTIITAVIAVGSILFNAGVWGQQVKANTGDIRALKTAREVNIDRLARIETKLDALLEAQRDAP